MGVLKRAYRCDREKSLNNMLEASILHCARQAIRTHSDVGPDPSDFDIACEEDSDELDIPVHQPKKAPDTSATQGPGLTIATPSSLILGNPTPTASQRGPCRPPKGSQPPAIWQPKLEQRYPSRAITLCLLGLCITPATYSTNFSLEQMAPQHGVDYTGVEHMSPFANLARTVGGLLHAHYDLN